MSEAKRLPDVPFKPGDGDRNLRSLQRIERAFGSNKGPLEEDPTPDVVDEMERLLEWATRDLPEETP